MSGGANDALMEPFYMPAGRALDVRVGHEVMHRDGLVRTPDYSTNIAAAWEIVEGFRQRPDVGMIVKAYPYNRTHEYVADIPGSLEGNASCTTAAHAIALCALRFVRSTQ